LYSFAKRVRQIETPQYSWLDSQGRPNDYFPEILAGASLSMDASKKFFEGSGHSAEQVYGSLTAGKPMSFTLPMVAKIHSAARLGDVVSPNVAAKLEGSDPALKSEYLVYTAHLDHLGIGPEVKGDKIYNGALDNASGSAILIETARAFSRMKPRPRRSILFVAVTAEESGLLGSDYFAHYPTVPVPPAAGRHGTARARLQCRGSIREVHFPVRLLCRARSAAPAMECAGLLRRSLWRPPHSQLIAPPCTGDV
jgi:hypothetical protein